MEVGLRTSVGAVWEVADDTAVDHAASGDTSAALDQLSL